MGIICRKKRCDRDYITYERNLDVIALRGTKVKSRREKMCGRFKGVNFGVTERMRTREGVGTAIKLSCVEEVKAVNSRLIWMKIETSNGI